MGGLRPRSVLLLVLVAIFAPAVLIELARVLVTELGDALRQAVASGGR